MKTTSILAAAFIASSTAVFAGAHVQVNENAADAAANKGTVLGATVSRGDVPANAAGKVLKSQGGWGNTGSKLFSPLGQVSKGGPGGRDKSDD